MSDYYSHRHPGRSQQDDLYREFSSKTESTWIWLAILLFAAVSLIAVLVSGEPISETQAPPAVGAPID